MGREARANPRSLQAKNLERLALAGRLARFAESFKTRAEYDAYLAQTDVSTDERAFLDKLLPERLRVMQ